MPFLTKCVYTIIYHINHFRQGNIMNKNINSVLHVVAIESLDVSEDLKASENKDIKELLDAQNAEERSTGSGIPEDTRQDN